MMMMMMMMLRLQVQEIHDTLMRECIARHGGYEIITEGDSFSIAFANVQVSEGSFPLLQWTVLEYHQLDQNVKHHYRTYKTYPRAWQPYAAQQSNFLVWMCLLPPPSNQSQI